VSGIRERRGATERSSTRPLDAPTSTGTAGLSNTRTRIVGARTGVLADAVVGTVRTFSRAGSVLRGAARRIGSVVTPLGWVLLGVVPLAFVAGAVLGWQEGLAIGYLGLVLLGVAALALIGRNAFRVTIGLPHHRVVVGDPAEASVTAVNPARRRILGATAEVPVGAGLVELAVPGLRAGGEWTSSFPVPTRRRGVVPLGPVRTVRADPIGLVRRELVWTERAEVIVHPRTIPIPSTSTGLIRDLEGAPTADLTPSDVSFHALREYLPGDDRRHIHWRSTAKTGTYMVRQYEQTRRSHIVVGLSTATADYRDDDEFELAVSVAGSLGVRAIRDGRTISVVVGERTPEYAKRRVLAVRPLSTLRPDRLLDDLAVVDSAASALGVRDIARVVADTVTGVSIAFLICGSTPTPAELRAASAAFGPDVEVIVVRCDPAGTAGLRRVPGLTVLRVALLEDLRAILARAAATS
jgi:uncharacterized protein (DUF58 family)